MNKNILTVVGITTLFLGICITPSIAVDNIEQCSMPASNGKTLYVGGTGEGNYTTIQIAIYKANPGDTVFVYDEGSPYYENIHIEKPINLIGENKNTTIIDGRDDNVIYIWCDYVEISNFTIISRFLDLWHLYGIAIRPGCGDFSRISNNIIKNSRAAIRIQGASESLTISHNILEKGSSGISLGESSNSNISYNIIKKFKYGISISSDGVSNNIIMRNQFEENDIGLYIELASDSGKVMQNNFINNKRDILFYIEHPIRQHRLRLLNPIYTNNYYDTWRGIGPKWIIGCAIIFEIPFFIPFTPGVFIIPILIIPWIMFDKHPAKEPYDIEGVI